MAELVGAVIPKRWNTAKGARNAAIFGIVTFPLDLLMNYDAYVGGLIRPRRREFLSPRAREAQIL